MRQAVYWGGKCELSFLCLLWKLHEMQAHKFYPQAAREWFPHTQWILQSVHKYASKYYNTLYIYLYDYAFSLNMQFIKVSMLTEIY